MFISKLTHIIENYDKYGNHRVNGVKVVYVLLILFLFNMVFTIPNVYFYFFYIPITAMTPEAQFEKITDKYRAFIYTVVGACIMVFLFNVLRPYPLFFLFCAFIASVGLYLIALHLELIMVPLVPVMLSLATYSLLYPSANANLYMIINNAITTIFSLLIILSALVLFPRSYYYRVWLRAFFFLLQETYNGFLAIQKGELVKLSLIQGHTKHIVTFARMIPRKLPVFTVFKINLLANRLHMASCVPQSDFTKMQPSELQTLIENFSIFMNSVKNEQPCYFTKIEHPCFAQLINAWNTLCSRN